MKKLLLALLIAPLLALAQPTVLPNRSPATLGSQTVPLEDSQFSVGAGQDQIVLGLSLTNIATVSGLTYYSVRWSKLTGPGVLTFSDTLSSYSNARSNVVTASVSGTYDIQLRAWTGPFYRDDFKTVSFGSSSNTDPSISFIAGQSTPEDAPTVAIAFTVGDAETAAGSLSVSASSSNSSLVSPAGVVLGGSGANRTITITPLPNQSGATTVTVSVSDGISATIGSFVVTVTPVNDPPSVSAISNQSTPEDAATPAIQFTISDLETASASLAVGKSSGNQTLVPNGNILIGGSGSSRTVTITPALNQTGTALITITVGDGAATTIRTFTLSVGAVNDAPSISSISGQTISEDSSTAVIAFTVGDAETAPGSLTVSGRSSNTSLLPDGNISFGGSGASRTVTAVPVANLNGSSTVTVTVSDGAASSPVSFLLTVSAANDSPTITSIPNQTIIGTSSIDVPFTINDVDGDSLFLTAVSDNQAVVPNASIVFSGTGSSRSARITPASNQSASCNVTITVSDTVLSAQRTFLVTVQSVNSPPTITSIANQSSTEDSVIGSVPFIIGDVDTGAASLTINKSSSNQGLLPDANVVIGGSGANRTVTLSPSLNASGVASVTVTVTDPSSSSASRTFTATWTAQNDAPTSTQIGNVAINEDSSASANFTISDVETPTGSLTVSASSSNTSLFSNASLAPTGSGVVRTIPLVPSANQSGSATITYSVNDGQLSATKTFAVTVSAVNDTPTMGANIPDSAGTVGQAAVLNFTAGDTEDTGNGLTYTKTSSNTTAVPTANIVFGGSGSSRTVSITGAASGTSTVTIRATDSGGLFVEDAFNFTATVSANTPPTISGISNQVINEDTSSSALAFTVGDTQTPVASLTVHGFCSDATIVRCSGIIFGGSGASRTVTLTPAANRNGIVTITISVNDGQATTSTSFLLDITAVNDRPTITQSPPQSTAEDAPKVVSFTVGDQETAAASLTLAKSSSNQTLVPDANIVFGGSGSARTATITPALDQTGTCTISVVVSDGSLTATNAFSFAVASANDPPTISSISNQTVNEDNPTGSIAFTITDAETPVASLTVSGNSSNTGLLPVTGIGFGGSGGGRTVTLTPMANANGASTVTISVSDGTGSASVSFTFTVNAVNDAPTISSIQNQSVAQGASTGPLSFAVGDIETAAGSLTVSGASSNPTLVPTANIVFGGSGANRTVTVTPAAGQSGSSVITVAASDGSASGNSPFTLTVGPGNTPPNISNIADQAVGQNGTTGALPFTVGDAETPTASLAVSATSSNPTLAPVANVVFGGSGASRTVTVTPVANQTGTATITVTVSDGNLTASDAFTVTVTAQNQPPALASISNKATNENTPLDVPVSATDVDNATLTWSAISSDVAVVPNSGLTFLGGTAKANTLRITPAANVSGTTTITVIANDGLPTLVSNVKIWDTAPHNAFTGLEYFNGAFFCVFREATSHLSSDGNIRILRSVDGVTWSSVGLLTPGVAGSDLRDPHLSIARNGSLRINADERIASPSSLKSVAYFSGNGTTWSGQSVIGSPNDWLWSIRPGPDADYSISYIVNSSPRLNLYRSTDGLSFSKVAASAGLGLTSPYTSEADFVFRPDGSMVAIMRGDDMTRAGVSPAPYSAWTWTTLSTDFIGGPKLTLMPDGRIINASRITRFAAPAVCELSLISPENGYIARYQTLSTSSDSGYCGVVNRDGYLWVSYYSSHEGKANIYFAKVRANLPSAFKLTVSAQNNLPTISDTTDKSTPQNTASGPHTVTVGDTETPVANLTLTGTSSTQTLVPNGNISFGGSGASRTVTVTPASGQTGQATITLTVTDSGGGQRQDTFILNVTPTGGGGFEYYVTTGGAFGNSGTSLSSPWNLDRARQRQSGKPESGSTVWIRAGRYSNNSGWSFSASGVTYRGYADEWPSIGADNIATDNSTIHPSADDITWMQLAINNGGRVHPAEGFYTSGDARRPKLIHCILFNLPQCVAFQDNRDDGGGLEVYGSILLFGGWNNSATDAGGHNVYFQHKNMSDSLQFENNVSAYSFSKLLNCGGSEAAFNRNCLFFQNILLMDGGASQAASDLQRPVEYIALVGNTPIESFIYKDNFHYGGQLLFGYPDPQNINLTVAGNYEFHQGYANGTFPGMRFEKFNTLIVTNNIVDASYEPTMDLNNSGAVTRTINHNAYSGTLSFNPGGSFFGWQGNGYDANGSATTTHRSTLYIRYYLNTRYAHRHKGHVAIHNPQSTATVNIDGAQAGLAVNDQFVVLNSLHPDLALPHAFRVVASGTYLGGQIAISMNSLTVAQPAGVSYSIPNCAPRAAALIVKKTN